MVGGFRDGRCLSEQLTIELLKEFHQYNVENGKCLMQFILGLDRNWTDGTMGRVFAV